MKKILVFCFLIFGLSFLQGNDIKDFSAYKDVLKTLDSKEKFVIDKSNIKIKVPKYADNPVQVPIFVDATKVKDAKRVVIYADYNPIPKVIDMKVQDILPVFSTNIKIARETPLRVLVQDKDNLWHVASSHIDSEGGGCDVSSQASENKEFAKLLGQTKGKTFDKKDKTRIKASIFHPMETGLIFGKPEFFIEKIVIKDKEKIVSQIETTSVISENPRFIFETNKNYEKLSIHFIDNDGNDFKLAL